MIITRTNDSITELRKVRNSITYIESFCREAQHQHFENKRRNAYLKTAQSCLDDAYTYIDSATVNLQKFLIELQTEALEKDPEIEIRLSG